ncbi:MAG: ABC transporter ATP-binding protein [Clostridia bacterium]|nr:ABC transporter ATP-binding protein [Clostridia bacterium]
MKNNTFKTIKRILNYIYKYKAMFFISLFLALLIVVGSLLIPIYVGDAIGFICEKNKVNFDEIFSILTKLIIIICAVGICQWLMNILNNKLAFNVTCNLRKDAFNKIQNLPLDYIDKHPYGEIVSKVQNDIEQLGDGLLMGFTQLFTGIATIIGTLICIFILSPIVAILILVLTPMSLFVAKFISGKTYSLFKNQASLKAKQTAFINEIVTNQKIIKSFNQEEIACQKFATINNELESVSLNAIFYSSLTNPCTRFVNSVIYAIVVICGSVLVMKSTNNALDVGNLSTLLYYANQYAKPFNEITGVFTEFQNTLACSQRVFDLLDEEELIDTVTSSIDLVKGDIKFENVCFSYNKNQKLIENLNLNVSQGQKVAIVGPTGCGKTTLINLLMRFYDVNTGKICLDNINIKDLKRENLRQNFGMVLQETFLKSGTIKDNIIIGKPNATMEEIITASKNAHSFDFIKKLPQGFDTVVTENGQNLSQGERQLLCITRVMLSLPPLLILDEATSNIDTRTEMKIQDAFDTLMKNKTSFIVAHRLSTIQNVDLILVMKDGNIIEQGNHTELLKKQGFYYELYNSQYK